MSRAKLKLEVEIKIRLPTRSATQDNHPNTSSELSSNTNVPQNVPGVNANSTQKAQKASIWFTSRGLQLPKLVQTIIDANTSVAEIPPGVNTQSMQNGEKNSSSGQYSFLPQDIYQEHGEREAYLAEASVSKKNADGSRYVAPDEKSTILQKTALSIILFIFRILTANIIESLYRLV